MEWKSSPHDFGLPPDEHLFIKVIWLDSTWYSVISDSGPNKCFRGRACVMQNHLINVVLLSSMKITVQSLVTFLQTFTYMRAKKLQ